MKTKGFYAAALTIAFCVPLMISCGGGKNNNAAQSSTDTQTASVSAVNKVFDISDSIINHSLADTISFGKLKEGEIAVKEVGIKNVGDVPLVIVDFKKTCGCVNIEYDKKPIMPSETSNVKFTFDSRGIQGWAYKTIFMQTSLDAGEHLFIVTAEVSGGK